MVVRITHGHLVAHTHQPRRRCPAFAISLSSYARLLRHWGPFNCHVIDSLSKTDLSLFAVCLSVSEFKRVSLVYYHNV